SEILAEKDVYPAWQIEQYYVYPDPRSRFADPTNPDRPPMPPDDPAAYDLSPRPQHPPKAGVQYIEGTGYLDLLAMWDNENRKEAEEAREKAKERDNTGNGAIKAKSAAEAEALGRDEAAGPGGTEESEQVPDKTPAKDGADKTPRKDGKDGPVGPEGQPVET